MPPIHLLPISSDFEDAEQYVGSLLAFVTSNQLFQHLCGGIHILEFLTKKPDLYSTVLPQEWREWFKLHDISVILDLLMHEDLSRLQGLRKSVSTTPNAVWRAGPVPPQGLLDYIITVRKLALQRELSSHFSEKQSFDPLPRHVAVGMKPKKVHEVQYFSRYIANLLPHIADLSSRNIIIDLGSGMNYLGRTLASPPHNKQIVALESRSHNINSAQAMDLTAKVAEKEKVMRNKKSFRKGQEEADVSKDLSPRTHGLNVDHVRTNILDGCAHSQMGRIQYINTLVKDGNLSNIIQLLEAVPTVAHAEKQLTIISLHSCGNLVHHGLRSLIINPSVKAVALIGCCYNLVTERLGPPTFKVPSLRNFNSRLDYTSSACDPHGFPISNRLLNYGYSGGEGIRMNITARMMACQAPQNWTAKDCESFFTRHFYRALLQRILWDRGLADSQAENECGVGSGSSRGWSGANPPITIGSLRKSCYESFKTYVRGAVNKIIQDPVQGDRVAQGLQELTDEQVATYEKIYMPKKKELSIMWSLMAFSASLVESVILVDRWLYLKEHPEVKDCWVEPVFDYAQSPRNLVVVGIKK